MCSRLGYATRGNLFFPTFRLGLIKLFSRDVIFPSQNLYTVLQGSHEISESRWGFPQALLGGGREAAERKGLIINSRRESLRGVWSKQLKGSRCAVLATHYYEYRSEPVAGKETKVPFKFAVPDQPEFVLAGLFTTDPETHENFASVITVPASKYTESYHDRMPAILPPNYVEPWLSMEEDAQSLIDVLLPYPEPLVITPADRAQLAAPRTASAVNKHHKGNETLDFPE